MFLAFRGAFVNTSVYPSSLVPAITTQWCPRVSPKKDDIILPHIITTYVIGPTPHRSHISQFALIVVLPEQTSNYTRRYV